MKSIQRALFRSADLERFMETGITTIRSNIRKGKILTRDIRNLPVNLFGAVMGIAGLAIAWRQAVVLFKVSPVISDLIGMIAISIFILLALSYMAKAVMFRKKVTEEFKNPIIGNFFGTIPISLLLLSSVIRFHYPDLGEVLWLVGVILSLVLTYIVVDRLMRNKQDLLHATPAWLIPGVGTLDIAVTAGAPSFSWSSEIVLMAFSIGSILAMVFFTLIFSRLMHHDPMPERLTPSLIILIAPFEVGFLAYINITGDVDMFASLLFYFGLFLFTIVFFKVFHRRLPFMLTWWAVGFPIAALSNASLKYAIFTDSFALKILALVILSILSILIGIMFLRTFALLLQRRLFS